MINVSIFVYGDDGLAKRLELFEDENISINSSIQNINDISKVFTDFSQSFTIPATKTNNAIFKHWYENSLDSAFNATKRKDAYIEIDTLPFRKGKIQLEKASYKKGDIDNLIDAHTLMFVAIHELSHVGTKSIGHKTEFWENFKFLLENAKEAGIHEPIDYKKKPVEYCSMKIKDNPYFG